MTGKSFITPMKFESCAGAPLTDNETDDFTGTRKGYKSKIYKK